MKVKFYFTFFIYSVKNNNNNTRFPYKRIICTALS